MTVSCVSALTVGYLQQTVGGEEPRWALGQNERNRTEEVMNVHRYADCADLAPGDEVHTSDEDQRQVTCPTCREDLGLGPIEEES